MSCACGCCDGLHPVTPAAVVNRPGLAAIRTRIGTQASFLETMLARLSSADYPELAGLKTRESGDAGIALLDAWATIADVLTFYQERIANEGYLRTATERRSLVELARLVGYAARPGVAASVFLAFSLEKDGAPVVIPKGAKANSVPGPGETMQAFETSEPLLARFQWNEIRPRLVEPQTLTTIGARGIYLKGTATGLKPGDMILYGIATALTPAYVATVEADETAKRTRITVTRPAEPPPPPLVHFPLRVDVLNAGSFAALLAPMALAPRGSAELTRSIGTSFQSRSDALPRLLASFEPRLARSLYPALRNAPPAVDQTIEVYAMRVAARAFGYNAPLKLDSVGNERTPPGFKEWDLSGDQAAHTRTQISLDNDYEVAADTRVVIERSGAAPLYLSGDEKTPLTLVHQALAAFGVSGKSLTISWKNDQFYWLPSDPDSDKDIFKAVRSARIHLGSERLELTDAPIDATLTVGGDSIELDGLYDGLDPGRWLIVEGERADILDSRKRPIPGIRATELVMLASVEQVIRSADDPAQGAPGMLGVGFTEGGELVQQGEPLAGDTYHTVITLAANGTAGLAYKYKPETVTIYANVAHATHGESRAEVLGSGNAAQPLQTFMLRQPPLTYVSARTPSGVASTLEVRVNDVLWHEAATLAGLAPSDRKFVTKTGGDDRVAVTFGNGKQGMRLPTGRENVTARYRNGIGAPGNVTARQISLLATRPLGVKGVINPMRASGGADREGRDAIRRNVPVALMALDRLLSTSDYADFARAFGGVGKAAAWRTATGVEVVIAGVADAPIDQSSDLFGNLKDALHRFGDPMVPLTLKVREQLSIIVSAGVRIDPDYLWEKVEPQVRAAMLAAFAFDAQDIGAPVFLSHAFRAIQKVRGVTSVDIDVFDMISADKLVGDAAGSIAKNLVEAKPRLNPGPDQIAYLSPAVSDTLILQELPS